MAENKVSIINFTFQPLNLKVNGGKREGSGRTAGAKNKTTIEAENILDQADNTKGWEGTKRNVDGSTHTDTATYDWNGTAWIAQ